ncbi:MAG TPA: isoprenylcysteine carboxylmethyltransferase family protein [Candidatus Binataceae bacterium]|nr:isoprenylcysteine carboxylmethyltransferase family protein [Candidatus Binataceae bacterium]
MEETTQNPTGEPGGTSSTGPIGIGNEFGMKIHPPALAGLCLLGSVILYSLVPRHHFVHPHQILGLLLVAGGAGLCAYAAAIFETRNTTKNPYGQPSAFVTARPYTFTRNPMYLGLTTILAGFAVFFGSAIMLAGPIVFYVMIDRQVIPREEATLEAQFGDAYREYKMRVRRWI